VSGLLSVVIPSSEDRWLAQTINDVFDKAAGPVEVIAVLNNYSPTRPLPERPGLTYLHEPRQSMRAALNAARSYVRGEFVAKSDEHCLFSPGFDEVLKADCPDNALIIPRRYSLDPENWKIEENGKGPRDQHYLSSPIWSIREKSDYSMHGLEWPRRTRERLKQPGALVEDSVEETMSWQGSFYLMQRSHYERLGPLQEELWGSFAAEPQELGLKTQLGGGQLLVSKKCYYAHLHKGKKYGRGYRPNKAEISSHHEFNAWYWMTDQWPGQCMSFLSFLSRWRPIPTWPDDVLNRWEEYVPKGADLATLKARALA
jgi:hypothetical protein